MPQFGITFHGTNDPWVETPIIETNCHNYHLPLYIIEDANHSLERNLPSLEKNQTVFPIRQKIFGNLPAALGNQVL